MEPENNNPVVTLCLVAYNQEQFIREAVESALNQTYEPLEVVFSDDCSVDRTFEIICEIAHSYTGPHRIILNRNNVNLGLIDHCNKAYNLGTGELVVVTAGDDVSLPNRVETLARAWMHDKSVHALFSSFDRITSTGTRYVGRRYLDLAYEPLTAQELIFRLPCYPGATAAYSRRVIQVSPLSVPRAAEDIVLPFRAALLGHILLVPEVLVLYRTDGLSSFNAKAISPMAFRKWKTRILTWTVGALIQMRRDITCMVGIPLDVERDELLQMLEKRMGDVNQQLTMFTGKFGDRLAVAKRWLSGQDAQTTRGKGDNINVLIFLLPKGVADVLYVTIRWLSSVYRRLKRKGELQSRVVG